MAEAGKQGMARQIRTSNCSTSRPACEAGRPLVWSRQVVWRECGGAGRSENGLGPTQLSPPNLSPLSVFVHTHSLNLQQQNKFRPLFIFFLIIPSP